MTPDTSPLVVADRSPLSQAVPAGQGEPSGALPRRRALLDGFGGFAVTMGPLAVDGAVGYVHRMWPAVPDPTWNPAGIAIALGSLWYAKLCWSSDRSRSERCAWVAVLLEIVWIGAGIATKRYDVPQPLVELIWAMVCGELCLKLAQRNGQHPHDDKALRTCERPGPPVEVTSTAPETAGPAMFGPASERWQLVLQISAHPHAPDRAAIEAMAGCEIPKETLAELVSEQILQAVKPEPPAPDALVSPGENRHRFRLVSRIQRQIDATLGSEVGEERSAATDRMRRWYLQVAADAARVIGPSRPRLPQVATIIDEPAKLVFPTAAAAVARLLDELESMLAVLDAAGVAGDNAFVCQLTDAVADVLPYKGSPQIWLETLENGVEAAKVSGHVTARMHHLDLLAGAHLDLGSANLAVDAAAEAVKIGRQYERGCGLARALTVLGVGWRRLGELKRARASWNEAHSLYEKFADEHNTALLTCHLADLDLKDHEVGNAIALLDMADAAFPDGEGPLEDRAFACTLAAGAYRQAHDLAKATESLERGLVILGDVHAPRARARLHEEHAAIAKAAGAPPDVVAGHLEATRDLYELVSPHETSRVAAELEEIIADAS